MTIPEEEKFTHIFGVALSGDQAVDKGGGRLEDRGEQHRKLLRDWIQNPIIGAMNLKKEHPWGATYPEPKGKKQRGKQ